jgi:hypothetical protein
VNESVRASLVEWIRQISTYQIVLLSPFIIGTVVFGIVRGAQAVRKKELHLNRTFLLIGILMLFGVSYVLIGNAGAYGHEYWQYYLMPGYALVTAVVWDRALRGTPSTAFFTRWVWCLAIPYVAIFADKINEGGVRLLSNPAAVLALAVGFGLFVLRKRQYLPTLALIAFVGLNLLVGFKYRTATEFSDRALGASLASATQPGDIIVTTANSVPQQWYYSGRTIVPNSVPIGADLEGWGALKEEDIPGLSQFVRAHQPIYLYLAEISLIPNASVMEWLDARCAYSPVAPRLVHVQRCDE